MLFRSDEGYAPAWASMLKERKKMKVPLNHVDIRRCVHVHQEDIDLLGKHVKKVSWDGEDYADQYDESDSEDEDEDDEDWSDYDDYDFDYLYNPLHL